MKMRFAINILCIPFLVLVVLLGCSSKMEKQVLSQARFDLENKFLHCGDSWYLGKLDYEPVNNNKNTLVQLKGNISIKFDPEKLTRVDRLNGIEWRGYVHIRSDLYRQYLFGSWGEWKDGRHLAGLNPWENPAATLPEYERIGLVIKHGKLQWSGFFYDSYPKKPNYNCEDIPK